MRVRWKNSDDYGEALRLEPTDPKLVRVKWEAGAINWEWVRDVVFRVPCGRRVIP